MRRRGLRSVNAQRAPRPNTPPLFDSFKPLDALGQGTARFEIPPGTSPSFAGLTVHHAFAVFTGGSAVFTSNAVEFQLLP